MKRIVCILCFLAISISLLGCSSGYKNAIQEAYDEGWQKGYSEGYEDGYRHGYWEGEDTMRSNLLEDIENNPYQYLDMFDIINEYLSEHDYVIEEYIEENY